eukprot:220054-Chlamydomonas_euryale.AAC.4
MPDAIVHTCKLQCRRVKVRDTACKMPETLAVIVGGSTLQGELAGRLEGMSAAPLPVAVALDCNSD